MMKYNYTIIIPFRDCTEMLYKACKSIPLRNDIQVIVVDNASNPIGADTVKDFYNSNLLYLTSSPSKGAGCARNVGLIHAKGKFLLFLDADDYFTPHAFDAFDSELESGFDIVFFNATSIKLSSGLIGNRHHAIDCLIKNAIRENRTKDLRYFFINPVCKMISRELIVNHKLKFQEVNVCNDQMFSTWSGHFAKSVKAVDEIVYVITEGEDGSSLTKLKNVENQFLRFKIAIEHYQFVHSVGKPEMAFRIAGFIKLAYKEFGFIVAAKWTIYALKNKVNLIA